MNFDLISDLHLDLWPSDKNLNFKGLGTSLTCIVAGDVSTSLHTTRDFLFQLADNYKQVIFVDGNHEHKFDYSRITENNEWLENELSKKRNITYLWDSTCIFESTAILGSNGWWTFDYLEPQISKLEQIENFCFEENVNQSIALNIWDEAIENTEFLTNVVSDFNKIDKVKDIVIITHTVPLKQLVVPKSYMSISDLSKTCNTSLNEILAADKNKKIKVWCFGHDHTNAWDETINGIRYVSNPRGRPDDSIFPVYYPKLVTL